MGPIRSVTPSSPSPTRPLLLTLAALFTAGCAATAPAAGETLCGAGTTLQGNTCVAASTGASCGAGTVLSGTECVPAGATITCGEGTTLSSGRCVATGATVTCGSGTGLQGTTCVATGGAGLTCGAGTVASGTSCVVASSTRKGFRDSCSVNADCGCYAGKADDLTCTAPNTRRLICKARQCTLDCAINADCTAIFPVGVGCGYGNACN